MAVSKSIEAIYEDGIFKPLKPLEGLAEHERVRLIIEPLPREASDQEVEAMLELAFATYEGLTEEQIREIESARLDQDHFFRQPA